MQMILTIVFVLAAILFLANMLGLALFLLGVGMFIDTGNWLWLTPAVLGALIMTNTD